MRYLKINNKVVDIDNKTAIGIDLQAYDVKNIGVRKISISNTFTIPATSNNLSIFGSPQNPQSLSKDVYSSLSCDYWVDNVQLITDARVRIKNISYTQSTHTSNDRITLIVYEKPDIWDIIKKVSWQDFLKDFVLWLQSEHGLPSATMPSLDDFEDFVTAYTSNDEKILVTAFVGNLGYFDPEGGSDYIEFGGQRFSPLGRPLWLHYYDDKNADGGHLSIFYKDIFRYIEDKYNVNFLTDTTAITGNIWEDDYANNAYIPARDIAIRIAFDSSGNDVGFYFEYNEGSNFLPYEDLEDKAGVTLYDVINVFLQRFNIVLDYLEVSGNSVIRMARFDDLETKAEVLNFSGRMTGSVDFKPFIDGYAQNNRIKFSGINDQGDEFLNSKNLTSLNENLDIDSDLFQIKEFIPNFFISDPAIMNLSKEESFKLPCLFIYPFAASLSRKANMNFYLKYNNFEYTSEIQVETAQVYSLESEYELLNNALDYPRFYTINKWLTFNEVINLEFFKLYWLQELNGAFFINKISGFNPDKANVATQIELFKVSDRTPSPAPTLKYWTDGTGDPYTDGTGDFWTYGL